MASRRRREQAFDEEQVDLHDHDASSPDEGILREELRARVRRGLAALPERCQRLLSLLVRDPPLSYREISAALDMPMGSIGPIRARCLDRLRKATGLTDE